MQIFAFSDSSAQFEKMSNPNSGYEIALHITQIESQRTVILKTEKLFSLLANLFDNAIAPETASEPEAVTPIEPSTVEESTVLALHGDDNKVWYYRLESREPLTAVFLDKCATNQWTAGNHRLRPLDPETVLHDNVQHTLRDGCIIISKNEQTKMRKLLKKRFATTREAPDALATPYVWATKQNNELAFGELWVKKLELDVNSDETLYRCSTEPAVPLLRSDIVRNWDIWMVYTSMLRFKRHPIKPKKITTFMPFAIQRDRGFYEVFMKRLRPSGENRYTPADGLDPINEEDCVGCVEVKRLESGEYVISESERQYHQRSIDEYLGK